MPAEQVLRNASLDSVLADARAQLTARHGKSLARHLSALDVMPGGNTRAVLYYDPFPLTFTGGVGARVTTLDGETLVDMISEYSAGLYGHSEPRIAAALKAAIDGGLLLGGPNPVEAVYARALVDRFPGFERVRFCNSGTEANIMAISAARAVTGRPNVIAMAEGYHGGVLTFGHGGSVLNLPFPFEFVTYNDIEGARAAIRAGAADLACVIIEPLMGGGGCIPASPAFLQMLREETARTGALLIFDEVMTSRLHFRGLHGFHGIMPDLLTMGKYLGGGASFGCFGGRADLMDRFDPARRGAFSHGGTFNNNLLSMSGGLAGLTEVLTQDASLRVNQLGDTLRLAMAALLDRHGIAACTTGLGSLLNLHFVPGPVVTPAPLDAADPRHLALFHTEMLLRGYYVAPRGMMALSLPMTDADIAGFLAAFEDFLMANRAVLPAVGDD